MCLADANRRAEICGLYEQRVLERCFNASSDFARRCFPLRAQDRDVFDDGQTCLREQALHHVLVHAGGRTENAGADVGDARQFEEPLDRAVFAEGPVQNGEDDIDRFPFVDPGDRAQARAASECPRAGALRRESLRDRRHAGGARPRSDCLQASPAASAAASQRPSLVMPIGTTSNFLRSIALRIDAAESSETSCSPLRPPKRMPTRSFFAIGLIVAQMNVQKGDRRGSCFPTHAAKKPRHEWGTLNC